MPKKSTKGVTIADIEQALGQKANEVSDYHYDPETGGWGRTATFSLVDPIPLDKPAKTSRKRERA